MSLLAEHVACILGGAVAGSEAAFQLAERGVECVVIDKGTLPYGKIEFGLPKWHARQRDQEETRIDEKLNHPRIHFVPRTRLDEDITLEELQSWGFSVILLALGAWRDRPLMVPGIENYLGAGFEYQNPFVAWFNQYHQADYAGRQFEIADGAIVIGGGLASIDVAKILMLETTLRALKARGKQADLFVMEKKGIPKALAALDVSWEELGLEGCHLYYRRRACDMPLVPVEDTMTPERELKVRQVREKLLATAQRKYLFQFHPCRLPTETIVENDRLVGLVFARTQVESGQVKVLSERPERAYAPLIISSIGSIPESIPGLPMKRQLFAIENSRSGKVAGLRNVYALGNAVTGRGNIRASRIHGRQVASWILDNVLDWNGLSSREEVRERIPARRSTQVEEILAKTRELQRRVGYDGDYGNWVRRHRPERLEDMIESYP
jgi:NADPH-dependent glutamate synthase beta subunit-like oxidoreductase